MIDPKVSALLNVVVAVLGVSGTLTAEWTTLFGQGAAQEIVTISGMAVAIIGAINGALHGVSAPKAGPLVQ